MPRKSPPTNAEHSRPLRILSLGIVVTAAVLPLLGWSALDTRRAITELLHDDLQLQELRGTILRLDEALNMSARMAAATGDSRWEQRYDHDRPALEAAIDKVVALALNDDERQAAAQSHRAHHQLGAIERRALELVRGDQRDAAAELLSSEAYNTQREIYIDGMTNLNAALVRHTEAELGRYDWRARWMSTLGLAAVGALILAWMAVLAAVRSQLKRRALAEQALEVAQRDLAGRVEERTAELAQANQEMHSEIAERRRLETELLESNRDLIAINEIHQMLFACQSKREVASTLADAMVRDFDAYFARVWFVRPGDSCAQCAMSEHCQDHSHCLHLIASSGHYTHIDGGHRRAPIGAFKIGLIASGSGKTISHDVVNDECIRDRAWAAEHGLRSFAGIPLVRDGEVVGVMAMFSQQSLPDHRLQTLELLAQVGASALANVEDAEALRDAEQRFMDCFFNAGDAAMLVDAEDERIVECNEKAVEMLRATSKDQVLMLRPTDLSPETQPDGSSSEERVKELSRTAFERGFHRFEWDHRRLDGEVFPVELTLVRVPLSGKQMLYSMWKDITAQRLAEERLRKLSLAVEQSPVSIVITDTQGTIEYVNPMFTQVTGYSAEEAIGRNPRILKSGNIPAAMYKAMWDRILAGETWTGEFENRKKNGELYWEAASICPIRNAEGSITHFLAAKQDITDRKRAERQLQEAKEAAESASESYKQTVQELETFNQLAVGRELRIIELKQEINELLVAQNKPPKFAIVDDEVLV